MRAKLLQLYLTVCGPVDVARQAPLSMGFSRQEYWTGMPCPPPGDLPDPGIEPWFLALKADSLPFELPRQLKVISYLRNFRKELSNQGGHNTENNKRKLRERLILFCKTASFAFSYDIIPTSTKFK